MTGLIIEPDQRSFGRVARALAAEGDGRALHRDLAENLGEALQPALMETRSALLSGGSGGLPHAGEPLRPAVAAGLEVDVRTGGRASGARIRARETPGVRGFAQAPKRLNSRRGWTHSAWGRGEVRQLGVPGWFDTTLGRGTARYRNAVERALEAMVRRIGRRA